jgi:hypothetical protein
VNPDNLIPAIVMAVLFCSSKVDADAIASGPYYGAVTGNV